MKISPRSWRQILAASCTLLLAIIFSGCQGVKHASHPTLATNCETWQGGITRGPTDAKRIAIVFTGHGYAEGTDTILGELLRHHGHASFFLTGAFLTNQQFIPFVREMEAGGHYVGPHSDGHLLYCDWNPPRKTLVTHDEFRTDLETNLVKLPKSFRKPAHWGRFFLPPFEHYNSEIVSWSADMGLTLINYTPGSRSNADYTGEADANFVSSQKIFDSILKQEREDPHGLNGFILLLHVGSGPGRTDKFHYRFGELLDQLTAKGYQLVRVDELLITRTANSK